MTRPDGPPALHVVDRRPDGDGAPVVVVVHGAMDRSTSFGRVARHLADLHVIRYDRRGYGRSAALGTGSLADHVDDLLAVVGERPVTVFGHSIGGVIALVAAERRPERIRSVLAYEAPMPWADWWPPGRPDAGEHDPAAAAERFMRRAIGDRYWERLPADTRRARRAEGPALQADIDSLRGDAPYRPERITVPVLSASGTESSWWHRRGARELAEAVPLGEAASVAGAQHGAHLSHPTATAHLVARAVERSR